MVVRFLSHMVLQADIPKGSSRASARIEKTTACRLRFLWTQQHHVQYMTNFVTLPSSHRPLPQRSGQAPLLSVDFRVDFYSLLLVVDRFRPTLVKKRPKSALNQLPFKGLLRVLGGAGEGVCGWKSGHKTN